MTEREALFNNSYHPIEKRTAVPMPFTLMPTPPLYEDWNKTRETERISVHAKVDLYKICVKEPKEPLSNFTSSLEYAYFSF